MTTRRDFLKACAAAGAFAPGLGLGRLAFAADGPAPPLLVLVFQRGGCDGLNLVGYYIASAEQSDKLVILVHGYGVDGKYMADFAQYYRAQGFMALAYFKIIRVVCRGNLYGTRAVFHIYILICNNRDFTTRKR